MGQYVDCFPGNEAADELAKEGANKEMIELQTPMPKCYLQSQIQEYYQINTI